MREPAVGLVVYHEVGRRHAALGERNHFELELPRRQAQSTIPSGAEDQWLAVLDVQLRVPRAGLRGELLERPALEDPAVLEHPAQRSPPGPVGPLEPADQRPPRPGAPTRRESA